MERVWNEEIATRIVQKALQNLGWKEDPPKSNHGSLADACVAFVGYPTTHPIGPPWCAAFACMMVYDAGITDGPKTASTGGIYDWGKEHGAVVEVPRMGDIGCLIEESSPTGFIHTFLIVHHFGGEDFTHTVEANLSNMVRLNTRPLNAAKYVRPYR